ncbi:MAG: hypothetical protein IJ037_03755 [Clostridia bacterium]|nr:hypothetical protein [Clostridia bacterium]
MDYTKLPKNICSGAYKAGHCQGIAVDVKKGYAYYSFTTMLIKTDLEGNFIGSVNGLLGHLGCITLGDDGMVYGSLEYKNDGIGRGIISSLGGGIEIPDRFYMAIFDVDKIDRRDMDSADVMRAAYLDEVTADYLAKVTLADGRVVDHRYGCSGIDGTALGPDFGASDGKKYIFVTYGIYADNGRDDNDYQVILKYDVDELKEKSAPLYQDNMHGIGPAPMAKYFAYTGNTTYGVQNFEYDPFTEKYFMAVYTGKKPGFRNPPMFALDAKTAPKREILKGVHPETEGGVLTLDSHGTDGYTFPHGSTGFASIGDGYFYVSHHGRSDDGSYTNVKLYRYENEDFTLID